MRKPSEAEILSLRELLQMETNGLSKAEIIRAAITDKTLEEQVDAAILAAKGRIKGMQQFITENEMLTPGEVQ